MKKTILLSGVLCLLTSFSASAQIFEYPRGADWIRNNNYQYWRQVRIDQELRGREHAKEEALENSNHDNGHHYAYGQDPNHHKKDWKDRPRDPNKNYDKDGNKRRDDNR